MKKILYIIILLSFGCNEKPVKQSSGSFFRNYNLRMGSIENVAVKIDCEKIDGKTVLRYIDSKNVTIEYHFFNDSLPRLTILNPKEEARFVSKEVYRIYGQYYHVYKFMGGLGNVDGEIFYFINPEIGVIIKTSPAWGIVEKLVSVGDDSTDKHIEALSDVIIMHTDFYTSPPESKIDFVTPVLEREVK